MKDMPLAHHQPLLCTGTRVALEQQAPSPPVLEADSRQWCHPLLLGRTEARGHGELVLVVDDDEIICAVVKWMLEASGYRVVTASDGAEALSTISGSCEPFQAVVTDMNMPVIDGPTLIRALSQHAPGLPVMAMSGRAEQEHAARQAGLRAGFFLAKPFRMRELLHTLNELLSRDNADGKPVPLRGLDCEH
jgi:two-component system, cell cycle sensor histidine kinase and response regulator CckA